MNMASRKGELQQSSKVTCEDCQHFIAGPTQGGIGFCALTQNRVSRVEAPLAPAQRREESGKTVPDRQGLPPDTNPNNGYAACFPKAPRVCAKFQVASQEK